LEHYLNEDSEGVNPSMLRQEPYLQLICCLKAITRFYTILLG